MGHVFTYNDARKYENQLKNKRHMAKVEQENWLMLKMLEPMKGEAVLDIGCGTGQGLLSLLDAGLQVTGIDPSSYMLDLAVKNIQNRADLHRCYAEELPFDDNSFNYSCIINTLEFVENPEKTLEEAFRVTKDRVFIGILNRYSGRTCRLRFKSMFINCIYRNARFFSIWELKKMVFSLMGDVPVSWKTVYQIPKPPGKFFKRFNRWNIMYKYPFGAFTGMTVVLMPRFKTRPLRLECPAEPAGARITSLARNNSEH
ncbi:SAM-dependent methyltransferase [Desulfonema limicola]|uniref:SAM-dependent methyltransferase n=1 Tax=Desulfonema limicola TaxID=45656 RepID=A0A975GEH1_9BACT|nr:class I SAM-dependent methyltransferase [Desulfonema limicola]QTA78105.1 SAM-dependent methyltransferase [Desulfonema limicola]